MKRFMKEYQGWKVSFHGCHFLAVHFDTIEGSLIETATGDRNSILLFNLMRKNVGWCKGEYTGVIYDEDEGKSIQSWKLTSLTNSRGRNTFSILLLMKKVTIAYWKEVQKGEKRGWYSNWSGEIRKEFIEGWKWNVPIVQGWQRKNTIWDGWRRNIPSNEAIDSGIWWKWCIWGEETYIEEEGKWIIRKDHQSYVILWYGRLPWLKYNGNDEKRVLGCNKGWISWKWIPYNWGFDIIDVTRSSYRWYHSSLLHTLSGSLYW